MVNGSRENPTATRVNPKPWRSVNVETYYGRRIPNFIDCDPSEEIIRFVERAQRMDAIERASIQVLTPPTGRYNCHGLVFASRRTNIPPVGINVSIDDLLDEDVYERVSPPPQIGDIIVYRGRNGEIDHTGYVIGVDSIGGTGIAVVWSKWGALGEYVHRETVSPYKECETEYWRLAQ
jgi:hypothetical protein